MAMDERRLSELIAESEDLQSDGLRAARTALPDLRDLGRPRGADEADPTEAGHLDRSRRRLMLDLGAGGLLAGLFGTGLGSAMTAVLARPAAAASPLDVQILQTASSLERLAINTYTAIVALPFIKNGNKTLLKFAQTTLAQHDAHRKAFQSQTTALGGVVQDNPSPHHTPTVAQALPTLKTPADAVRLAVTLETVARDTYLSDLAQVTDTPTKTLLASVMGVEAQHLAVLRTVLVLVQGGAPQLVAIPVDPAALPAAAGNAAFPDGAIPLPTAASPAQEGALS